MATLKYWDGTAWQPLMATGASAPTGAVMAYGGTVAPTGWLVCDGTVYNNTSWPALAQILGNTFGGTAGTSFAVPDLRGRDIIGAGQGSGLTNRVLGASGGAETVTLTVAQMPSHNHTAVLNPSGLAAAFGANTAVAAAGGSFYAVTEPVQASLINLTGGGGAHENMPPFRVLNYIIKAAAGGEQPLAPDMVGATSVSVPMRGAWPTASPTPSQGVAFTTPAGVLRAVASATGYVTAGPGPIRVEVWIDGVPYTTIQLESTVSTGVRLALGSVTLSANVTAGTHYVYFRQTGGVSDTSDFGSFFGVVTPATGSLAEPATVLNLRKTANQTIGAAWTVLTGWSVQSVYPVWAPENAGVFTIPADGYYRLEFQWMTDTGTGSQSAAIYVNGVPVIQANDAMAMAGHGTCRTAVETNLKAGDTVAFYGYSSVAANVVAGPGGGYAATTWVTRAIIRKVYSGGIPGGMGAPDTPWTAPVLQNGWVDYGSGWEPSGYRRIGGITYLRGLIRSGTVTNGTVILNLPAGFRPNSDKHIVVATGTPSWAFINAMGNGNILANAGVNAGWLSLANVSFPADQ